MMKVLLLLICFSRNIPLILSFGLITSQTHRHPTSLTARASDFDKDRLYNIPVVICPGFGNDEIDYSNPLNQGEEVGFISALSRRGFNPDLIKVLPLRRYEWVRVAGGLFDPNFYTGRCQPDGFGYGWYVNRLRKTIEEAYVLGGKNEKVLLIGHSAGGWLGRAALGDGSWPLDSADDDVYKQTRASDRVRALITVGAIHKPPAGDAASTCVTRGVLAFLEERYPGAYLASEGIAYVSVGGDAIVGSEAEIVDEKAGSQEVNDVYKVRGERSASTVAYTAYKAVSGDGQMTGDGVVPLEWSMLEGSRNIVLDGVLHSINEAGTTLPTDRWYGSENVVDRWLFDALEEAGISSKQKTSILKWPEWKMGTGALSSESNNKEKVDLLRRFLIGSAPTMILARITSSANAAENAAEAIRLVSSKTIPGLGPPDVYYPPYFVGKWRVTRLVTSSDDNDFQGLALPLQIVSEMRFVPYDAGKDFGEDFSDSDNSPAIADRAFNERAYNNALSSVLEQLRAAGSPTSKAPTTIQKIDWSPTNPNVLSISYADGSSKEVKVTKRSSDVDGKGDGVYSSEFRRVTVVPSNPSSIAGGIPTVYKSRILTKYRRADGGAPSANVDMIEGIEMAYVEQGTFGDTRNDPAGGTGALSSLYGNDSKDIPNWKITKTKLLLERIR